MESVVLIYLAVRDSITISAIRYSVDFIKCQCLIDCNWGWTYICLLMSHVWRIMSLWYVCVTNHVIMVCLCDESCHCGMSVWRIMALWYVWPIMSLWYVWCVTNYVIVIGLMCDQSCQFVPKLWDASNNYKSHSTTNTNHVHLQG